MSCIIYDDEPRPFTGGHFNFADADATKFYLQHYSNRLLLAFIATNKLATFTERQQANKELVICDRKLEYWRRHPNFEKARADEGVVKLLRDWKGGE